MYLAAYLGWFCLLKWQWSLVSWCLLGWVAKWRQCRMALPLPPLTLRVSWLMHNWESSWCPVSSSSLFKGRAMQAAPSPCQGTSRLGLVCEKQLLALSIITASHMLLEAPRAGGTCCTNQDELGDVRTIFVHNKEKETGWGILDKWRKGAIKEKS